jgi:hypothetical protein
VEVLAATEWLLLPVVSSFADGAPWSAGADLPSPACFWLRGAVECTNPLSESERRRTRVFEVSVGDGGAEQVDDNGGARWRFFGTEDRRLPVRRGTLPIQGVCGGVAEARRRNVLFFVNGVETQKGFFVISSFSGLFFMNLA